MGWPESCRRSHSTQIGRHSRWQPNILGQTESSAGKYWKRPKTVESRSCPAGDETPEGGGSASSNLTGPSKHPAPRDIVTSGVAKSKPELVFLESIDAGHLL